MSYWKKRAEKFQELKLKYNSSSQEPSTNGRYIILSQNGNNSNSIEKNIQRSNLNYDPIDFEKMLRQKRSINKILSEKKVVTIKKTDIGIVELSEDEFKLINDNSNLIIIPDTKIKSTSYEYSQVENIMEEGSIPMTYGVNMANVNLNSSFKGKGVKIAILDTGIDRNHPDLKNKIADGRSWIGDEDDFQDTNGHGTHCAGIAVGGVDPNGKRYGVAPDARLCIGKVLDHKGEGFLSNLLFAIDWAIQKECNVISMSLSSRLFDINNTIHSDLFQKAHNKKIIMVAAAGNNSDHSSGTTDLISNPAAVDLVSAVGAIDKYHKLYNKSNVGLHPLLTLAFVAPGVDIYSTWLSENGEKRYKYCSGTSASTPFVAGVFALTISKFHNNRRINSNRRRASPEQLLNAINNNIFNPGNSWRDINKYGTGVPLAPK